eukprot:g24321.t1
MEGAEVRFRTGTERTELASRAELTLHVAGKSDDNHPASIHMHVPDDFDKHAIISTNHITQEGKGSGRRT